MAISKIGSNALAPGAVTTKSSSDPTATTNGILGDLFVNTTSGETYVLTDATTDANVWTNVGEGSGQRGSGLVTYSTDYLVIAGGGGGGNGRGGGGAAGGYRNSYNSETSGGGGSSESALTLTTGEIYSVIVGAGGTGSTSATARGEAGGNSSFS